MKKLILIFIVSASALAQSIPQSQDAVIYNNIVATSRLDGCLANYPCIDNRSQYTRQSDYSSYRAYGLGTWSVDMQFADGAPSGWVSFGSTAQVSNITPTSGIGFGIGPGSIVKNYHDYIRFVITGNAIIMNYFGTKQAWWSPTVASIAYPLTINQGGTGSIYGSPYNVLGFGAAGNGTADDTAAVSAAITAVCALPSYNGYGSKSLVFPPPPTANGYYKVTSTLTIPCSNIIISGSGSLAPIIYTGTGSAFSMSGKHNITFSNLFLAGPGGIANQNGILIDTSNSVTITSSFIGGFGVAPTVSHITGCTNANPTVCTTTTAPTTGGVQLGGFAGGTIWPLLNSPLVATRIDSTHFSLAVDATTAGALTVTASSPAWATNNASGCAIRIDGDSQNLQIGGNGMTVEVWGTGICSDGPTDLLNVHDVTFGPSSPIAGSGWAITQTNSSGAGQIKLSHLNITTPGGALSLGPLGGQFELDGIQYENLTGYAPLMNTYSTAFYLDSALSYSIKNLNAGMHSYGNYCYLMTNSSFSDSKDLKCFNPIVNEVNNNGVAPNVSFDNTTNLDVGTPSTYTNNTFLGIFTRGYWNGYREWGGVYPQSPFHFNTKMIPLNFTTTLGAAIATTGQTTVTLYSWQTGTAYALGFRMIDSNGNIQQITTAGTSGGGAHPTWATTLGATTADNTATWTNQGTAPIYAGFTVLYTAGGEQIAVTAVSFPTLTVARGINGTTAATAANGSVVNLGAASVFMVTSSQASFLSGASYGCGVGYNTAAGGPYAYCQASAPSGTAPIQTPIPLLGGFRSSGPLPGPFALTCVAALEGQTASFTDGSTATPNAVVTGGGAHHVSATCDGIDWRVNSGR